MEDATPSTESLVIGSLTVVAWVLTLTFSILINGLNQDEVELKHRVEGVEDAFRRLP